MTPKFDLAPGQRCTGCGAPVPRRLVRTPSLQGSVWPFRISGCGSCGTLMVREGDRVRAMTLIEMRSMRNHPKRKEIQAIQAEIFADQWG